MGDGASSIWSRLLRGEQCDEQVEQLLSQFNDENALKLNLGTHRTAVQPFKSPSQAVDAGRLHVLGLDQELALRYSNLKASSKAQPAYVGDAAKAPKDTSDFKADSNLAEDGKRIGGKSGEFLEEEEEKILGQELAARFAALKTPSHVSRVPLDENPPVEDRGFASQGARSGAQDGNANEAEQVQRLLASVQDSIRLEKSRVSSSSSASFPFEGVKEGEAAADDGVDDDEISESEVDRLVDWAKDAARLELSDSQEEEEEEDNTEDEGGGKRRSIRK